MDRYHIYEAIGKGKHSTVYKGRRKKTIQYYAIKSVDKSQRPRVLREVQVLRATDSPLVLKFHAWYETANHLWLILEYCVGGDLLGLLKQDERLPEKSIARFALDLVSALRVAHEAGVLHCDLKPSNVLIDEDGRLKLCWFG
jgi:serine/threonine-protein kinase ULK4